MNPNEDARCSCGHTIEHAMVTRLVEYNWLGWLMIFIGISAHPTRVRYQCLKCNEIFLIESDPRVIRDKRRHD
jgi:hypothetical protein